VGAVNAAHTQDKKNILLTLSDIYCVRQRRATSAQLMGRGVRSGTDSAFFMNHADLSPIAARGGTYAGPPPWRAPAPGSFSTER